MSDIPPGVQRMAAVRSDCRARWRILHAAKDLRREPGPTLQRMAIMKRWIFLALLAMPLQAQAAITVWLSSQQNGGGGASAEPSLDPLIISAGLRFRF
jgi:hypothetical protein